MNSRVNSLFFGPVVLFCSTKDDKQIIKKTDFYSKSSASRPFHCLTFSPKLSKLSDPVNLSKSPVQTAHAAPASTLPKIKATHANCFGVMLFNIRGALCRYMPRETAPDSMSVGKTIN